MAEVGRIGRYQILGELGRGAMGVVYRAYDPSIGRTVALKTIRLSTGNAAERAENVERLQREAQLAGRLSHPNIVTVFDMFEEGDTAYICMECVEGPTLEAMMASRRPLSRETVLSILKQAAGALDYAHSRGVVHRDVKPGNIMLHEDRLVKITDFGIGKVLSEETTMSGAMLGTPSYMSPEQVQSRPAGGRSDQFSLAVIAYELLTGEKPFTGYSLASIVYKVCNEPPPGIRVANPTLAAGADAVFHRALAKDPAIRFPNTDQFVSALTTALAASPEWVPVVRGVAKPEGDVTIQHAVLPETHGTRRPEKRATARFGAWVFALLGAAVVAGIFWYAGSGDDEVAVATPAPPPATAPPAAALEQKPSPAVEPDAVPAPVESKTTPAAETPKAETKADLDSLDAPAGPMVAHDFRIETTPDGATVTVDAISGFTCRTPCRLTLATGKHSLKIEQEGYRPLLKTVSVPDQKIFTTALERRSGTVMVRSNPPGAQILVNGSEWSSQTPTMMTLPVGKYKLEFRKTGFRNEESNIEVHDGAVMNLDVNWTQSK